MDDQGLLRYSQDVRLQAQRLLRDGEVIETLNKYGKAEITGSYKYDLMYGPDIDIEVISDNPREDSLSALSEFLDKRKFQKYEYGDFKKFPRENRPESFIIVLVQEIDGLKWEIEIWFFKEKDKRNEEFEEELMNLGQEQKMKILGLKHQRKQGKLSKHKVSSYEIYEAVLNKSVEDLNLSL